MKTSAKLISFFFVLLGFVAPAPVGATITKDQAILYVQNTWGIVDLSSDVISKTLDTSYSGVPYTDWIDFLINSPTIFQPLSTGDYSTAAKNAYNYASGAAFTELISECGLTGVAAPAELAVWPIQAALNNAIIVVNDDAFKDQCRLYFLARAEYTATQIASHNAPNILFTDDYWLQIVDTTEEKAGYPRYSFTSSDQFYSYAETLYQAKQAASSFNAASSQLAQNFHDAAVSGPATAPTITIGPSGVTVSVGDTATFTVTASGTGPLYYHWQKNNVDIPNATFWYYITPTAQSANNGDQYRVRVTNTQGSQTSGAATLIVNGVVSSSVPSITSVSPSTFTGLPVGQTRLVCIIGSGFTSGSTLTFNDGTTSYPGRVPTFVCANELDYNVTTGTNQENWTVQVVNGAQTSNLGHFTVNAPSVPPVTTGSLVVNLSPAGVISAGAQWQVDGTGYNSSGQVVGYLIPSSHTISFKPISGYTTPANQIVTINANAQTTASGTYSVNAPSTYALTLNQGGSTGYINPSPVGTWNGSAYVYNANSVVQLTANANPGYHFLNWSGDISGTANPTTITMNGNKNVAANFATGDPNMGTVTVTIQPPEAVTAGVTWGFNDSDFRASGTSYSYYPETVFVYLHGGNGWIGVGGWVIFMAGQTTNYVFSASNTNGSVVGTDPRNYFTFAGSPGISGFTNAAGTAAQFSGPWSVAADAANNIYVADTGNNVIRKIDASGVVSTFAGMVGSTGSTDGVGTNALFSHPIGVAVDRSNNVYVADFNNSTIRKINPNGTVSTLAGLAGNSGSTDATGSAARFNGPAGVTVDTNGNVYVADNYNCTIRKITPSAAVSTLAGTPLAYGSVDATGSAARFRYPSGVAVDNAGNVYVADTLNSTIREVTSGGVVTTLAGFAGSSGAADGTGNSARFSYPNGVAVDSAGNVYVADSNNHIIRKVTPVGVVTTLAGLSGHYGTNDGNGSIVRFNFPDGLALDSAGNIFVADGGNQTIRATQPLTTKVDQFISFAPILDKSAGDASFSISATASSGLPVYLNVLSGPAVLDTNSVVTLFGGGTVNVIAWQPGNSNYNAATPVLQSFNVTKIPQTITFGSLSQQKVGDAPFSVYATSDSGLPVSLSVSGPAVLNGSILTLTGWGTVTITASQPGNASYVAATNVVQPFFVVPPDNTIVAPQKLSDGSFQLAFYGFTGSNYLIQTSTNLHDWQSFTNFTGTNFLLYFSDSSATNYKQRFYRIRSQ